jgi:hypothetical protein
MWHSVTGAPSTATRRPGTMVWLTNPFAVPARAGNPTWNIASTPSLHALLSAGATRSGSSSQSTLAIPGRAR